jgi:hypothetical protein
MDGRDAALGNFMRLRSLTSSPHVYSVENAELRFLLHHPCYIPTLNVTGEQSYLE